MQWPAHKGDKLVEAPAWLQPQPQFRSNLLECPPESCSDSPWSHPRRIRILPRGPHHAFAAAPLVENKTNVSMPADWCSCITINTTATSANSSATSRIFRLATGRDAGACSSKLSILVRFNLLFSSNEVFHAKPLLTSSECMKKLAHDICRASHEDGHYLKVASWDLQVVPPRICVTLGRCRVCLCLSLACLQTSRRSLLYHRPLFHFMTFSFSQTRQCTCTMKANPHKHTHLFSAIIKQDRLAHFGSNHVVISSVWKKKKIEITATRALELSHLKDFLIISLSDNTNNCSFTERHFFPLGERITCFSHSYHAFFLPEEFYHCCIMQPSRIEVALFFHEARASHCTATNCEEICLSSSPILPGLICMVQDIVFEGLSLDPGIRGLSALSVGS